MIDGKEDIQNACLASNSKEAGQAAVNGASGDFLNRLQPYFEKGIKFHGWLSPGLVIGIIMVDLAKELLGNRDLIDAVVETKACVPDAIQLMTACSYGNGWMRVKDWGKLALTLYDKRGFDGVRVYVDFKKIKKYHLIEQWLIKTADVDKNEVSKEIQRAGRDILSWQKVKVAYYRRPKGTPTAICTSCGEAYIDGTAGLCQRCSGKDDYYQT